VARAELLRMLPLAERGGGEELIDVLRSLAEVTARAGRSKEALDYAGRAIRVAEETGNSPGPVWYTAATAELVGGTLARAQAYAERGVRASRQEHDKIYLSRNLYALGQARLRLGDARVAAQVLREVRDLEAAQGIGDPAVLRWHADLAAALVGVGDLADAAATIVAGRTGPHGSRVAPGVAARMDRSEALLRAERGDVDGAVDQLAVAASVFAGLGQPIEQGHALLVCAQVERRRRRYAAARAAAAEALAIFAAFDATPWVDQAARTLARVDGGVSATPAAPPAPRSPAEGGGLTPTETRIASLVRAGASNREIAAQLFLSVKTVEASLTRIYRKLGVRSRTQLSSRLTD
jgi:DNA-binding CsgD family transcriptional regulator